MKVLITINHPAHVHYFKNFIKIMENKGHIIIISAQNKDIAHKLLENYKFDFHKVKRKNNSAFKKISNLFISSYHIYKLARKYKPDVLMGFGGGYITHVSKILNIPSIIFDDTEHASLSHKIFAKYADIIITPACYQKEFGNNQIRFNGYMELCYLHPKYFIPDPTIFNLLKIARNEKYIILRFVSWDASHDIGQTGIALGMKYQIVKELSKHAKVFISSEGELPDDLKKYQIVIPPEKMHDVLFYSMLFLGESPTMTTESAILGTPAICISSWACDCGNFIDLKKYNLIYCFKPINENSALEKSIEILNDEKSKEKWVAKGNNIINDKIDSTAYMVWFIENYPESVKIMKDEPGFQKRFK
jgi:uncharacterized protein